MRCGRGTAEYGDGYGQDERMIGLVAALGLAGVAVGLLMAHLGSLLAPVREGPTTVRRQVLMALAGAAVGIWSALGTSQAPTAALTAVLGWQLLLITVLDAEHFILPDRLTLPLLATGLLAAALLARTDLIEATVGAVAGFSALWLLALAYRQLRGRDGLGDGDPILLAAGGAWVGWIGLPSILLWASAAGLSVVAARTLTGRRVAVTDRLPFGPCLAAGIWLTWLIGPLGL